MQCKKILQIVFESMESIYSKANTEGMFFEYFDTFWE